MTIREPVVVIFGPTAVGKTELLLELFAGTRLVEIITADSMQVYRHLDVGTAKPAAAVLEKLPHHLISILEPTAQFNAGEFVRRADQLVTDIRGRGRMPVISGGTAYYLRSFLYGLPEAPPAQAGVRRQLQEELRRKGLAPLVQELERVDPVSHRQIAPGDSHRVLRALEVYRSSGRPLSVFKRPDRPRERHRTLLMGLDRPRDVLYRRIDARVERMFAAGLVDEVRKLLRRGLGFRDPGMRGIGYREFFEMRKGCLSWRELEEMIRRDSRRYAKRQLTFFRSLPGVRWFDPENVPGIRGALSAFEPTLAPSDAP